MLKKKFCDGQGTVRRAVLYVDRFCLSSDDSAINICFYEQSQTNWPVSHLHISEHFAALNLHSHSM